ncbi:MAG TPA: hypothetical protein VE079_07415 [Ensifer sp.]|nr:hypothetical protein [Ensifer sp.]
MPIRKRHKKRNDHTITPAAVTAFNAGEWLALHAALDLAPWQYSPLDVTDERRPHEDTDRHALALKLRRELQAAA